VVAATALTLCAPWRIGVDVGGTFTDLAIEDRAGTLRVVKVPTVSTDPSQGVLDALRVLAEEVACEVRNLLEGCEIFFHGTTIATNTLIEASGAKTGMLTTRGFRDSLEIRRGIRDDQWDHRAPFAPVLVPRYLRLPVGGRIDKRGHEIEELSEQDVRAAIEIFEREGVESVAVCLFNSFLNPVHEEACGGLLQSEWVGPGSLSVSLSSRVLPTIGEYARSSAAVANAYLAPRVGTYLRALGDGLAAGGLRGPLLILQSNGGAASLEDAVDRPVNLLLSGPAAAVGALEHCRSTLGGDSLLSMEIGGTSCDVMLMSEGRVASRDTVDVAGYPIGIPAIEIHSVGAGGGTLAKIDAGGLLVVGPEGAGADPGPACYGLGGDRPTITDAQMVLGRMRSGSYARGAVSLDTDLARRSIDEQVAGPAGLDVETAARGIVQLLEQRLVQAVERLSVERGIDARGLTLVAAGGAGALHGVAVARRLGMERVYVPRRAGGFCAEGMLHSDVRHDSYRVYLGALDSTATREATTILADLQRLADDKLRRDGFAADRRRYRWLLDLRYRAQQSSVTVEAEPGELLEPSVRSAFESEHDRLFGHVQPGGDVEITALRLQAIGLLTARVPRADTESEDRKGRSSKRRVWIDSEAGWLETPIVAGSDLTRGEQRVGPLIVEEDTTTILVGVGDCLRVDEADNFDIQIEGSGRE
jgi:N-methylhydantoinase A